MVNPARWLGVCVAILGFFFLPQRAWAVAVFINEFLPDPSSGNEWVEFYNPDGIDLSIWTLEEITSSGNTTSHSLGSIENNSPYDIFSFSSQQKLNNDRDKLTLRDSDGQKVDEYEYASSQKGVSYARIPDGGNWSTLAEPTKGTSNGEVQSSPDSGASPSPESSLTSEYKINEVKDENGNTLSSTKVYVDGKYTHHYAPETLEFCEGCYCDSNQEVSCGFGEHTIKLEKTGHESWSETKTFSSGNSFEVNPILKTIEEEDGGEGTTSPSPTSQVLGATSTTGQLPAKIYTKEQADSDSMLLQEATFTGEILGATESGEEKPEEMAEEKNKDWLLPLGLSGGGLALLSAAAFPLAKPKLSQLLARFPKKTRSLEE